MPQAIATVIILLLVAVGGALLLVFVLQRLLNVRSHSSDSPGTHLLSPQPSDNHRHTNPPLSQAGANAPSLILSVPGGSSRRIVVDRSPFLIGRDKTNRLHIEGQLVSRYHAMIVIDDRGATLVDRDSTNGTYVNGKRISQHVLRPGDMVQVGRTVLQYQPSKAAIASPQRPSQRPAQSNSRPVAAPSPTPSLLPIPTLRNYAISLYRRGGAAVVYRAQHLDGQPILAVKVLTNPDPYIVDKFQDEGKIVTSLQHPHIARAFEVGQVQGQCYFIMEFCEGGTLREHMPAGRPLPADQIATTIAETCDALAYAHTRGIVHRDIKPENIMFDGRGRIKLVDFGIAKLAGRLTQTVDGMIVGTPFYLSYEQAKGIPVDARSDLYSLGVVLYEMLSGQVPFRGEPLTVVRLHLTASPPSIRKINPQVSEELERVVMKALAKNRGERFASAEEMSRAILSALGRRAEQGAVTAADLPAGPPGRSTPLTDGKGHGAMVTLMLADGRGGARRWQLSEGTHILGRDLINPQDHSLSRRHAQITVSNGLTWIEDMGSGNGTFHNGRPVAGRVVVRPGDELRLANTTLKVMP